MKKSTRLLPLLALGCFLFQSCVTSQYLLTDNAVGSKKGVAKLGLFKKDQDISISTAAKNGKISKIGTVEVRVTTFLIFSSVKTIVSGE